MDNSIYNKKQLIADLTQIVAHLGYPNQLGYFNKFVYQDRRIRIEVSVGTTPKLFEVRGIRIIPVDLSNVITTSGMGIYVMNLIMNLDLSEESISA